jgi:hypothetical protein
MKTLVAAILICLALSWAPALPSPRRESCSCSADDGSCSVSVTCLKGCLAFCPSNNCRAVCVGSGGGYARTLSPTASMLRVSTNRNVEAERLRRANTEVFSEPTKSYPALGFTVQNAPTWDIRQTKASDNSNNINSEELDDMRAIRRALVNGERMSVCFGQVSAADLAAELSSITRLNIRAEPEGATTIINYSAKGVTLKEIVAQVSTLSGIQFSVK